jgi:hypothetical protein
MQKAPNYNTVRALRIKPIGLILPQSLENSNSTKNECQIFNFIQRRELTNALECLEKLGYCGDDAVTMLRYLQSEG